MVGWKNKTLILIFNRCSKKSSSSAVIKQLKQINKINPRKRTNKKFLMIRLRHKMESQRRIKKQKMAKSRIKNRQEKMMQ